MGGAVVATAPVVAVSVDYEEDDGVDEEDCSHET